jgi:hypothetical protein
LTHGYIDVEHEQVIIDKIMSKIPAGTLSEDEVMELKEGLVVLRSVKGVILIGKFLKQALIWFAVVLSAWFAAKEWILKMIGMH